jgi:hypothetical protein
VTLPLFAAPYFDCLREHGVTHVFNAWTRMPALGEQVSMSGAITAPFTIVRALLRQGRPYEQAVEKFSPYREVTEPNPEGSGSLRALIRRMKAAVQGGRAFCPAAAFPGGRRSSRAEARLQPGRAAPHSPKKFDVQNARCIFRQAF